MKRETTYKKRKMYRKFNKKQKNQKFLDNKKPIIFFFLERTLELTQKKLPQQNPLGNN